MIPSQKDARKTGTVSLESHSQILAETRRIQDLVYIKGKYKNLKDAFNNTRNWYPQNILLKRNFSKIAFISTKESQIKINVFAK